MFFQFWWKIYIIMIYPIDVDDFGERAWASAFEHINLQLLTPSRTFKIWIDVRVVFKWFQPYLFRNCTDARSIISTEMLSKSSCMLIARFSFYFRFLWLVYCSFFLVWCYLAVLVRDKDWRRSPWRHSHNLLHVFPHHIPTHCSHPHHSLSTMLLQSCVHACY